MQGWKIKIKKPQLSILHFMEWNLKYTLATKIIAAPTII